MPIFWFLSHSTRDHKGAAQSELNALSTNYLTDHPLGKEKQDSGLMQHMKLAANTKEMLDSHTGLY